MSLLRFACACVLFACAGAACAANKTWIGTSGFGYWSLPANWQGGVPQPGDHLSFPIQVQAVNDIGPLTLDGIDANASVTLGGGALTFTNRNPIAMSNPSAVLGIDNDLTFAADTTIALTAKSVVFNGKVTLSGGTFRILAPGTGIRFNSFQVVETIPTSIDVQADSWLSGSVINATGDFAFTGASFNSLSVGLGNTPARIQAPDTTIVAGNPMRPMDIVTPAGATTRLSFGGGGLAGIPVAVNLEGGTVILKSSVEMYGTLGGDAHVVIDTLAYLGLYNRTTLTGGITVTPQGALKSGNSFSLPRVGPIVIQGRFDINQSGELVESFQCDGGSYFGHSGNPLHVSGPVVLNNCAFNLYESYDPVPPGGVTLISNGGSPPVTGTFASLPEGAPLSLSPDRSYTIYRISYHGGDGNDVVALYAGTPGTVSSKRNLRFESPSYSATTGGVIPVSVIVTDGGGAPVAGEAIGLLAPCILAYGPCTFVNMPGVVNTDASGRAVFAIQAGIRAGQATLSAMDRTNASSLPATAPLAITGRYQDMWWTASENGWGLTIIQHGENLFCVLFVYDASGQPTWLVMPSGIWDPTHTTWIGEAYTPKGSPFYAYQAQALQVGIVQGTVNIRFFTADTTLLEFISTDGSRTNKTLTRQPFGGSNVMGGHGDMWWGGASQNGWGIAVMEQVPIIFPIWYTYDASGTARWYVVPVGSFTSPNVFEGRVYKTTGSPWFVLAYDPTKLHSSDVGSFKLNFNGDSAALDYNVEGHSGSIPLVKEPF